MHNHRSTALLASAATLALTATSAWAVPGDPPRTEPHVDRTPSVRLEGATAGPAPRGGGPTAPSAPHAQGPRPYVADLGQHTLSNRDYRRVVHTGARTQLALMSIPPGGEIGQENHARVEQLIFVVSGTGRVELDGAATPIGPGSVVVVTPGTRHNVLATGDRSLQLYTVYAPPNHIDARVHSTRAEAERDRADEAFGRSVR